MTENKKKTGRNPKKDPAVYRYTVRFMDVNLRVLISLPSF